MAKKGDTKKKSEAVQPEITQDDSSDSETEDMWDTISDLEGDPDYHDWVRNVWQPLLTDKYTGVTQEGVYRQWRRQDGLCAVTGVPLIGVTGGKGMYSPEVVTHGSGKGEVLVVVSFVATMHQSLSRYGVSWPQFLRLVSMVE